VLARNGQFLQRRASDQQREKQVITLQGRNKITQTDFPGCVMHVEEGLPTCYPLKQITQLNQMVSVKLNVYDEG
jgi:hypothetical protein